MILFALRCRAGHEFDAWFRNNAAYEARDRGAIACPVCGDTVVTKALMAPRINRGRSAPADGSNAPAVEDASPAAAPPTPTASPAESSAPSAPDGPPPAVPAPPEAPPSLSPDVQERLLRHQGELLNQLRTLRKQVESHCTYVGDRFAEEARRIHYGEVEAKNIYGETSSTEAEELREEGVAFQQIPWIPTPNS